MFGLSKHIFNFFLLFLNTLGPKLRNWKLSRSGVVPQE